MSDEQLVAANEELVKRLRVVTGFIRFETGDRVAASACLSEEAADRIEALEQHVADLLVDLPCGCGYDNPTDVCMKHLPLVRKLTEQLEAARADAKEAEAYAEELERDLKTCRMAQAVMDNTVAELEKQCEGLMQAGMNNGQALILAEAKLAKAVEALRGLMQHMPDYADTVWQDARETLAEVEGESHE